MLTENIAGEDRLRRWAPHVYNVQRRAIWATKSEREFFKYGAGVDAEFDEGVLWDERWEIWLDRVRVRGAVAAAVEGGIPSRSEDGWSSFLQRNRRSPEFVKHPPVPPPDPVLVETAWERERAKRQQALRELSDREWAAEEKRRRDAAREAEAQALRNRQIVDEMVRQKLQEVEAGRLARYENWRSEDREARLEFVRRFEEEEKIGDPARLEALRIEYEATEASRLATRAWNDRGVYAGHWYDLAHRWVDALPDAWRERALRIVIARQGFQLGTMWANVAARYGIKLEAKLETSG